LDFDKPSGGKSALGGGKGRWASVEFEQTALSFYCELALFRSASAAGRKPLRALADG